MKKLLKALGWTVGILGVLYLAAYFILGALATRAEKAADEQWRAAGQPALDELLKRWPGADDNPAALELEKLSAGLGLPLAPSSLKRNPPADPAKSAVDAAMEWKGPDGKKITLADWLNDALSSPPGDAAAFPPPLAGWLDANKPGMDALIAHLAATEPAWAYRLSFDSPLVNLSGINGLHRLLLARSLRELQSGDAAAAEHTLGAAWRLGDALARNPVMINAILLSGMRRGELVVLRRLPAPDAGWLAKVEALRSTDQRGELRSVEGRLLSLHTRRFKDRSVAELYGTDGGGVNVLLRPLAVPYLRYAGAEMSRITGIAAEVDRNPAAASKFKAGGDPTREGNWIVRPLLAIAVPNYGKVFDKLDRTRFEAELTGRILGLRAARAAAGKWPDALEDGASKVFPGEKWTWTADGAAGGTLSFSKPPKWTEESKLVVNPEWKPAT